MMVVHIPASLRSNTLSSKINKLRFHAEKLAEFQRTGKFTPLTVQIAPTENCQSRCSFCSYINRDSRASLDFADIMEALVRFKSLGTLSVELTGGGNPLLYKCKRTKKDINDVITTAGEMGLLVGVITNSLDLNVLTKKSATIVDWIRVSGIGLYEGFRPDDIDLGDVDQEKTSFMFVYKGEQLSEKTSSPVLERNIVEDASAILKRFPRIKQVRISPDVTLSQDRKNEILASLKSAVKPHRAGLVFDGFEASDCLRPSTRGCFIGGFKPLVATSPDYDGRCFVYMCCCFSFFSGNRYSWKYVLCESDRILEKWSEMAENARKSHTPYDIEAGAADQWTKNCQFCLHTKANDMLGTIRHGQDISETEKNVALPDNLEFI